MTLLALPASAQTSAASPDARVWRASINGWFPSIHSKPLSDLKLSGPLLSVGFTF